MNALMRIRMNLLVIEDDSLTASFVVKGLREAGYVLV